MDADGFTYHPQALPDYVNTVAQSSAQLDDIRSQAQNILNGVREFFDSMGADSFINAQMMINSGIDEGKEIIMRHSTTVDGMHQEMIAQDVSAANSFGGL
jgi:uncharacterized protein YukE